MDACYPWQRQYLNWEFLKYEEKRIKDLQSWYSVFKKSNVNNKLEPASFYVVPIELVSSWRAAIADLGNFRCIGLSALFNSPQVLVIGLIPDQIKIPPEYSLIEITTSKRTNLFNKEKNIVEPILIIDSWNSLKSDTVYVDVPCEKRIIQKILKENLINDDQISLSLQSPIISSPYVEGSIGGISLSSISGHSLFAKELIKTVQLMVPPEYRTLSVPKMAFKGSNFEYFDGITFHLAERPHQENNILSSIYAKQYDRVEKEITRRNIFNGELSIFSVINPDEGTTTQIWKTLMKKFTDSEVTLPKDIDDLIFADVDLTRLKKIIDENIWMQVVSCRQHMPRIDDKSDEELNKITLLLKEDFDTVLSDIYKKSKSREYLVSSMMFQNKYNLKRLAQSLARSDEKNQVESSYLKKARNLILDNFTGFINHPGFSSMKSELERNKENSRYSVIQTELINHPYSSISEIFEAIKSTKLFNDIYDLQNLLDWLYKNGRIIRNINEKYLWV